MQTSQAMSVKASTSSMSLKKCEYCDEPLDVKTVEIRGKRIGVPCFGSCGCYRSKEKLASFGQSGYNYSPTNHRCPVCGETMMLDGRLRVLSDCPRCGYSCVFSSDLNAVNVDRVMMRQESAGGILAGTGVPSKFWGVDPDLGRATKIEATGKGFFIVGGVGTAKTLMAASIAKALAERGWSVRFASTVKMLTEFKDSYGGERTEGEIFDELSKCDLLIIDDLGKENPTSWAASMLYTIIDNRYGENRAVIVTTNLEEDALAQRMAQASDISTAQAILSRLHEMTHKLVLGGPDRRSL